MGFAQPNLRFFPRLQRHPPIDKRSAPAPPDDWHKRTVARPERVLPAASPLRLARAAPGPGETPRFPGLRRVSSPMTTVSGHRTSRATAAAWVSETRPSTANHAPCGNAATRRRGFGAPARSQPPSALFSPGSANRRRHRHSPAGCPGRRHRWRPGRAADLSQSTARRQ